MADEDKTSPVITAGPAADVDVPDKVSLSSEHPEKTSRLMIAGFVINVIMMIYSHFGASGSVKLSIPEGAEINLDVVGACSGLADLNIIENDPAFFNTPNVVGFEAGVQCITDPDRFNCAANILIADFGISSGCASCVAQYTDCLQAPCFNTCRLQVLDQEACEVCSDINCESEFEKCTGIDFFNDLTEDACLLNNPRLVPGNELFDNLPSIAFGVGASCVDSDIGELFCRRDEFIAPDSFSDSPNSITNDCLGCLSEHAVCIGIECASDCANSTEQCDECVLDSSCAASFNLCSGLDRYNVTTEARFLGAEQELKVEKRELQAAFFDGDCVVKNFEMFERLEITFVDSVIRAFRGGSLVLALLIGIASGIWPYCKNMLMAYAWFAKLTQRKRHKIITILGILGKWSLVDVFAVVLLSNGILIQKIFDTGAPFVLIMEPRPGIYFFGFAALWALAQGEIIHHYGLEYDKKLIAMEPKDKNIKFPTAAEQISFRKRKTICAILAILSLGAAVTGVSLPNLDMETVGALSAAPGENDYLYNVFQLGIALFDDCAIYDGHESKAGAVFLGLLFIFLVAVLPVVATGSMFFAVKTFSITSGESADSNIVRFALAIGNFAALDVWMVTLLVFSNQFSGLIRGAVGTENICGLTPEEEAAGVACVGIEGAVGIGFFYLVAATFLYWFAQCLAVKLNAEVKYYAYHYHNK